MKGKSFPVTLILLVENIWYVHQAFEL